MKRTALALHTLIKSRFRGDDLQLIAFGRAAQVMEIEELTGWTPAGTRAPTCITGCCWPTGTSASTPTPNRCC